MVRRYGFAALVASLVAAPAGLLDTAVASTQPMAPTAAAASRSTVASKQTATRVPIWPPTPPPTGRSAAERAFAAGWAAENAVGARLDEAEADAQFQLAAAAGHAEAARRLGLRAKVGVRRAPDLRAARRWLTLAAERGDVPAARALGELDGGPGDEAATRRWLAWAARRGDRLAAGYLADRLDDARTAARNRRAEDTPAPPPPSEAEIAGWRARAAMGGAEPSSEGSFCDVERAAARGSTEAALEVGREAMFPRYGGPVDLPAARRWYALAAASRFPHVQRQGALWLGRLAKYGGGGPVDLPLALAAFRLAAESGDADARYTLRLIAGPPEPRVALATFYAAPDGTLAVRDPAGGAALRPPNPDQLAPEALRAIARNWEAGVSTWPDRNEAIRWYERAAARDDVPSLLWLVKKVGTTKELTWLEQAARLGSPEAAIQLAAAYRFRDPARGWAWLRDQAARGHAGAIADQAQRLALGIGAPRAPQAARELYRRAGESGQADAWAPLGRLLLRGEGGPTDRAGALAAWRRGTGDVASARLAGSALLAGDPGERAAGLALLAGAAAQGDLGAALALGAACEAGRGLRVDRARAERVYRAALAANAEASVPEAYDYGTALKVLELDAAHAREDALASILDGKQPGTIADWSPTQMAINRGPLGTVAGQALLRRLQALEIARGAWRVATARARKLGDPRTLGAAAWLLADQHPLAASELLKVVDWNLNDLIREEFGPAGYDKPALKPAARVALLAALGRAARAGHPLAAFTQSWIEEGDYADGEAAAWMLGQPTPPRAAAAWAEALAIVRTHRWPAPGVAWTAAELAAVRSEADARDLVARRGLPSAAPSPSFDRTKRTPSAAAGCLGQLFWRKAVAASTPAEGEAWEAVAAELGDPDALAARAQRLEAQGGVALAEAHVCWNLAAAHGHPAGASGRRRVEARLGAAERLAAEARALARWEAHLPRL